MPRKTKKQEKALNELLTGLPVLLAIGSYLLTNSFIITVIVFLVVFGSLVAVIIYRQMKRQEIIRKSGIKEIDKMQGLQFEEFLGSLFRSKGYKVKQTRATGDYGADLILIKGDQKIVVQAKRYQKYVGLKAVQEVNSSKNYYQAKEAWVVTNSYYTKQAVHLARSNNVRLIDREELIQLIMIK